MRIDHNINYKRLLYIFFIFLSLSLFFFSTNKSFSKTFDIENIDIKRPFEINFNKKKIFNYLENKNVFPSVPNRKKFLFFPIIIE